MVLVIIAVLISILLPALGRARQQADGVKCASNLRQMHISSLAYADKNNGFFPAPWSHERVGRDPNNWVHQWPYMLSTDVVSRRAAIPAGYSPLKTRTFPGQNITPDRPVYAAIALTVQNYAYAVSAPRPKIAGAHLQGWAKVTRRKGGSTKPCLFGGAGESGPILGPGGNIVRARPAAHFANAT